MGSVQYFPTTKGEGSKIFQVLRGKKKKKKLEIREFVTDCQKLFASSIGNRGPVPHALITAVLLPQSMC